MSLGLIPHPRSLLSGWDRWDPWALFDDFDRLPALSVERFVAFTPRVDITESDDAYVVQAELPGLEEKDFEVVLEDDVLTLKGEKRHERETSEKGWHRTESAQGRFERRFRLPQGIAADEVRAEYRNGILKVTLPKTPEARPEVRTIPIQTA